ncbi:maleylpyruvate isomerase family mycothiol-dependent enzyme [Sporichthya brevicatena]|uniref:Maleylpyruvate isomerase family mycothiol-dependent enzyme n=1 Tax=Sporichthya brevicatena TaxID=171442 RepID=A0ABN1HCN8_9ACTN
MREQTRQLADDLAGADLTTPAPSCPGWNAGQVVRHLGGGLRWAAELISTRATEPPADTHFRDLSPYAEEDPAVLAPWIAESGDLLAAALEESGPDAAVWTPMPEQTGGRASFFARRFAHEAVIHRADATLPLGRPLVVEPDLAADGIDEWMELGSLPFHFEVHPQMRELLGPGRTVHLHATDTDPELHAEWVLDLTGDAITWRRAHEKSAVAVRGPITDLLLMVYRRRAPDRLDVVGDASLLEFWLERVPFG